jgi:hypothetical protein
MAPILAPLFGVLFLRGHISIKNWTYCPLLRESATPFKSTCLFIRLKEVPVALYGPHLHWYKPVRTQLWKSNLSERSREVRNSNPACVNAREEVQKVWHVVGIYFK